MVRVFVSSPGDVQAERDVLDRVIQRINDSTGQLLSVRLELWKWERNLVPQIGPPPQAVVDEQTPPYGVYLGIMANRFGGRGGASGSGTEKEFRDAIKQWGRLGKPWILFYFNDAPVRPKDLDPKQYPKVQRFRAELEGQGIYATYEGVRGSDGAFFEKVEQHLRLLLQQHFQPRDAPEAHALAGTPRESAALTPTVPEAYRAWLQTDCAGIDLPGLQLKEDLAVRLSNVYVPLATPAGAEERERLPGAPRPGLDEREKPQLLVDLLDRESLYVPGAPGSGKSMFCRWVGWLTCAGTMPPQDVQGPEGYVERFPGSVRGRLPVLVRLRDFWHHLPSPPGGRTLSKAELEAALDRWLRAVQPPGLNWPILAAHLEAGSALVIVDGVDEVPPTRGEGDGASDPRAMLLAGLATAIPSWVKRGNRVLVTSRPYGLRDDAVRKLGLRVSPIGDLAPEQAWLLVQRWFHVLGDDLATADSAAGQMIEHIRERPELEPLVANPMLLTATCIVYRQERKRLPQDKYDLYTRIVDNVLHHRYTDALKEIDPVRNLLSIVAYGMHTGAGLGEDRKTPEAQATYSEIDRMIKKYQDGRPRTETADTNAVKEREKLLSQTGLLLPRDERRASFYHLSIQEFLAGERLLDEADDLGELVAAFHQRAPVADWRNTLSFAFGAWVAKHTSPEQRSRLLERVVQTVKPDEIGLQAVAAECLEILMARGTRLQPEVEERFRQLCLSAIEREVPLPERFQLGRALGRLGDPRVVADLRQHGNREAYVRIEAGDYVFGGDHQPFRLEESFLMARYPVTNSQYRLFIAEDGYRATEWWSPGGRAWLNESGAREPALWTSARFNGENQPVVGVSFWEAEAFCAWAGARLPSEREWEAAARGPEGFEYPWGGPWDDGICNTWEARLLATSPVGLFPRSRTKHHPGPRDAADRREREGPPDGSPNRYGLEDIAGNVWEWCADPYGLEKVRRVLRGGSWYLEAGLARATLRNRGVPDDRNFGIGFRVVVGGGVRTR